MLLVYPPIQDGMNHEVELTDDIVCFTDGSQQAQTGTSGAGVYIQLQVKALAFSLGHYTTVFQAEVFAILACVNSIFQSSIAICSDSQAALKALRRPKVTSGLIAETISALKDLSTHSSERLLWVPGHLSIPGNEIADQTAKEAAITPFVRPEPVIGISDAGIRSGVQ